MGLVVPFSTVLRKPVMPECSKLLKYPHSNERMVFVNKIQFIMLDIKGKIVA